MRRTIDTRRQNFKQWMAANGLKPAAVARTSGVPRTTIYSYLDGTSSSLLGTTEARIAQAFGATVEQLFGSKGSLRSEVGVWGKIGAGADIFPMSDFASTPMYEVELPATLSPEEDYVAFEIDGFSMPPAEPGWLVVFRNVEVTPQDLINSPCMVDTADGRRLFKRLRPGYQPGRFNLESWDGSPLMVDVEVLRVLPFAALTPGRKAR